MHVVTRWFVDDRVQLSLDVNVVYAVETLLNMLQVCRCLKTAHWRLLVTSHMPFYIQLQKFDDVMLTDVFASMSCKVVNC